MGELSNKLQMAQGTFPLWVSLVPHHRALSLSASRHRHPDLSPAPAFPVHATVLCGTLLSPMLQCWGIRALRYVSNSVLFPKFQSGPTLFLPNPIPVPRQGPFMSWTGHTLCLTEKAGEAGTVSPPFLPCAHSLTHPFSHICWCRYVPSTVHGAGNKTLQTSRLCPPGGTSREGHAWCH